MSQSDYIKLKKTQNLLYNLKSTSNTLTSGDYTRFKQYAIETSVVNTLPQLNQLIPFGNTIIFDMNVNVKCPKIKQNIIKIYNPRAYYSFISCI
jgi:hypothetical protein